MEKTYRLEVAGLVRNLPIIPISDTLCIASFVILGDTGVVKAAAPELVKRLPGVDVIVTAEAKGIPLVHEMAHLLGMERYYVARKSTKAYMADPVVDEVNSITTTEKQMLCMDGKDAQAISGKRVAIVDDVISTGESLEALERLVTAAGGIVTARAAILAEGDAALRDDIIFLEELPLFPM